MYHLTVKEDGKLVRSIGPVDAPQAIKAWFDEEVTGYQVECKDAKGKTVTKSGLREIARHAQRV